MRKVDPIKQQERRRHILNAAAHCFAEHGFHGTSTAQICERAGMSPGNLFHYYRSKADIIEALIAADTRPRGMSSRRPAPRRRPRAARGWLAEQVLLYLDPSYVRLGMEVLAEAVRNPACMRWSSPTRPSASRASRRCWHRHGASARRDAAAAAGRNSRHDPAAAGWHFQPPRGRSRIRRQGRTSPDRARWPAICHPTPRPEVANECRPGCGRTRAAAAGGCAQGLRPVRHPGRQHRRVRLAVLRQRRGRSRVRTPAGSRGQLGLRPAVRDQVLSAVLVPVRLQLHPADGGRRGAARRLSCRVSCGGWRAWPRWARRMPCCSITATSC